MNQVRRASLLYTHARQSLHSSMMKSLALCAIVVLGLAGAHPVSAQQDNGNGAGPGESLPVLAPSDQKAGSILIYPLYTSLVSASTLQNTRINMTNVDVGKDVFLHLFFVDGNNCSVSDSYTCLTPNQTMSLVMSDLDPGVTGYLIVIAVDDAGCPINFNSLIGDAYIKFSTGHAANLGATAVPALSGLNDGACPNPNDSSTTTVKFDGVSYAPLPRVLAISNLSDRASGNDTILVLDRIGGSLVSSAASLGSIFGLLYDDAEKPFSFSFTSTTCQFRAAISNNFPRTTPRFETLVPAGRSGWMKLSSVSDGAIVGATLNFNPTTANAANAFNQGHNLHALTFSTAAALTIPVFPPSC